ncbi:MAG: undecaprenyl-phosphate alpha-N-acetylglucosaminyl 1-phosphate transferase [Chromatiaceae bacterium]|nr:undecaprenyl-phosphate alpha-N-acetylglucosaminyl 1-phosphate transferase [Chromatiaceae bacterium]
MWPIMESILAFLVAAVTLKIVFPLAPKIGLVDHPGERRKVHRGAVPPIGGIAIFAGLLAASLTLDHWNSTLVFGLAGAAVLVIVGALDDRFALGHRLRFGAQIAAALLLVIGAEAQLHNLGNLLGFGDIHLGFLAIPFTVFAMVGIINAFNMIDGIDGLAASLALIAMLSTLALLPETGALTFLFPVVMAATVPFLMCNLEACCCKGRKVFLGDAGSMLLGYMVVWGLITASQGSPAADGGAALAGSGTLDPVVALWLIALPLMDTFSVMGHRMLSGNSPFAADKGHLHHLLARIYGSTRTALLLMLVGAVALASIGLAAQLLHMPEPLMFYGALGIFGVFVIFRRQAQRIYVAVRRRRRQQLASQLA